MKQQKDPINPSYYDKVYDKLLEHKFNNEQIITICEFNIFKYLYRWRDKNGVEDLKKAKWYISEMIKHLNKADKDKDTQLKIQF